jgi:hypothetical protein
MTDHRKLLKQASDALAKWSSGRDMDAVELNDLVFALEAALAEPQEPVGWLMSPYGEFQHNHLCRIALPSTTLNWRIPLMMGEIEQGE